MVDFEVSHGKPRPMLPRPSDTEAIEQRSDSERLEGRRPDGVATANNRIGLGRGWKSRIREAVERANAAIGPIGSVDTDEGMRLINSGAEIMYRGVISNAPVSPPLMRMNAASCAIEWAIADYLMMQAGRAGLTTGAGLLLLEHASRCRARAERLSVTAHVMSMRAKKRATKSKAEKIQDELNKGTQHAK